jgi:hypothetical protein
MFDVLTNVLLGAGVGLAIVYAARWVEGKVEENKKARLRVNLGADVAPDYMQTKSFTIRDALNGQYIQFHKHKYNPNGPDTNEQCVYIVKDDESLLDAISVVLVLMDKES